MSPEQVVDLQRRVDRGPSLNESSKNLARVLVSFQQKYLSRGISPSQSSSMLCQVWSPQLCTGSGVSETRLRTTGQPFIVVGLEGSDMLSLFRCMSCRYEFGIDKEKPLELGAPGRVFLSCCPEARADVKSLGEAEYHRRPSAELCAVESCILLPVFPSVNVSHRAIAVIEVVGKGIQYLPIVELLAKCLKQYGLSTSHTAKVSTCLKGQNMYGTLMEGTGTDEMMIDAANASVGQLVGWSGVESGRASKRLRVSPSSLKGLMNTKSISTVSKEQMSKYESCVDHVLQGKRNKKSTLQQLPMTAGFDSRWGIVQDLPNNTRIIDPPDGAFPIQRRGMGRIEPHVTLIQKWPGLERIKYKYSATQESDDALQQLSSSQNEDSDWMGMVDPFMLDLMMMPDFGDDEGLGDEQGLPLVQHMQE